MTIDTQYLDADGDKIKLARPALLDIAQRVNSLSTASVATIANLRLVDKTKFSRVIAVGYYASGDCSTRVYWYDSTDTTSTDNGGSIIVATDGGRWKLRSDGRYTVREFGAKGDGTTDDTAAFSAAAQAAPAANNIAGAEGTGIPRANQCEVDVPDGIYLLSSEVDTGGRDVTWRVSPGAKFTGYEYLNGELFRPGLRQVDTHHGTTDFAATYSVRSGVGLEEGAEVLGISSPSQLASYPDRDSVTLYVDNYAQSALINVGTANYTATTVTIAAQTAATVKRLRKGMIIDTKHSPKWSGFVDSWNADGSVITVTAWYQSGGGGTPGTPANGTGCVVNGFTKVWAHNANVALPVGSYATSATGFELGLINDSSVSNVTWGFDSVNLGTHKGTAAFMQRGSWQYGYFADGADTGFYYKGSGAPLVAHTAGGVTIISADGNGNIELGHQGSAGTRFIDFHSSGNANDNDARIKVVGGAVAATQGLMTLEAAAVETACDLRPSTDNARATGSPSLRWTAVYAVTGTIQTSDARLKEQVRMLSDVEKAVALRVKGLLRAYKFNDAVASKGDGARIHIGVMAQDVAAAFQAEGLDPNAYALFCYDEWAASPQVLDDDGNVALEGREGGARYGIRYDELLAFVLGAL